MRIRRRDLERVDFNTDAKLALVTDLAPCVKPAPAPKP